MDAKAIRRELRKGKSDSLHRRRQIALLSAIGAADMGVISLYQMGVIKKLPDLPGAIFDANKVSGSKSAYALGLPDGPVSLGMYALNMILASAKGSHRTGRSPWLDFLLAGAVLGSVAGTVAYLSDMFFKQKKACPYCLVAAGLNFAMLPLVFKEARESWNVLRKSDFNANYSTRHPATTPAQVHLAKIPNLPHHDSDSSQQPREAGA
jgi:uncharacterized membrane protein